MKRLSNKLIAGVAGGVAITIVVVFAFIVRPRFLSFSGGLESFDGRYGGYFMNDAWDLLEALGPEGIAFYTYVQLPLDMIFPAAYALALGLSIKLLQAAVPGGQGRVKMTLRSIIFASPFLAAVFDYWENWLVLRMLNAGAQGVTKVLVDEASRTTTYKWVFLAIGLLGFVISMLRYFLYRRRAAGGRL
jgi:hypothetical protein